MFSFLDLRFRQTYPRPHINVLTKCDLLPPNVRASSYSCINVDLRELVVSEATKKIQKVSLMSSRKHGIDLQYLAMYHMGA